MVTLNKSYESWLKKIFNDNLVDKEMDNATHANLAKIACHIQGSMARALRKDKYMSQAYFEQTYLFLEAVMIRRRNKKFFDDLEAAFYES